MSRTFALLALLLVACGGEAPATGRGAGPEERGREGAASAYAPTSSSGELQPATRRVSPEELPPEESTSTRVVRTTGPAAEVRDLTAELGVAIGDPSGCLSSLPPQVQTASVYVSATVFEDGVLSSVRASVAPGTAEANRCVQRLAESARLRPGVPDAPRTVSTRLDVGR